MTEVLIRCLVLMLFVYSIRDLSAEATEDITEYIDQMCYTTVNFYLLGTSERIVKLSTSNVYAANSTCFIRFEATSGYRLMFKFLSVEMYTCSDFLAVYGDTISAPDAINPFFCSKPHTVLTTPGSTGYLLFISDGQGNTGGASILVSMFKTKSGPCGDKHFNCDNDRCIPDDLKCNSRDNCGNNHDEEEGCRWWLGLAIGLSVMGVFGIGALIFFIIFIKKYSGRKKVQNQSVQGWTLTPPQQSWTHTQVSNSSGNQQQMQHVSQSPSTKNDYSTQYWNTSQGGQGQQATFQSSSFSEPPTYAETAPAPTNYTLPDGSAPTPPPVPVLPSSLTASNSGAYGPQKM